jgi:hypothetical protein
LEVKIKIYSNKAKNGTLNKNEAFYRLNYKNIIINNLLLEMIIK